jgi:hypothetical protein
MARAIELLPPAMRPFYDAHRTFIVEHTVDPDLWRTVGFEEELPRHFLNLDAYGAYPFSELPREYDAALARYGRETLARNGLVPWRTAEMFGRLRRALEQSRKPGGYALEDVKLFSSVVAHYVADGHVPFHAVLNFDGQRTGQTGIHARFETDLFVRYRAQLGIRPAPIKTIPDPARFMFDVLLASFQLAAPLLAADREAIGSNTTYDDRYFSAFFANARPTLERRLGEAITAVASMIASAWEQAGKPALPIDPVSTPQRRRTTP